MEPFPIVTLQENASPIQCPSRIECEEDQRFIREEIKKLAEDGVIKRSQSSWRAQVKMSKTADQNKQMCIVYPLTANRYTVPGAYPISVIEQLMLKVSSWKWFSYIELKSTYHQLRLLEKEKDLTAFEANEENIAIYPATVLGNERRSSLSESN